MRLLCFLLTLLPLSSKAFSLSKDPSSRTLPLEIQAENGMVCSQDKRRCTALGPVVSTKGTSVLKSQKLVAHFQEISQKKQATSSSSALSPAPSLAQDLKKIEAFGKVQFFDVKGGVMATGEYAQYLPASGQLRLKGHPVLKDPETTVLAGSEVIFYEKARMATTVGRSTLKRADKLMQADMLKVYFTKDAAGQLVFDRLEAEGNVVLSTLTEIAKARRGVYRAQTQVAELFDDVILTRRDGQLRGNYGRYDMLSGQSQLFNNKGGIPSSHRVQAILNPKTLKKKKSN